MKQVPRRNIIHVIRQLFQTNENNAFNSSPNEDTKINSKNLETI
jgi:hypothetical protein